MSRLQSIGKHPHCLGLAARARVWLYDRPSETSEGAGNAGRSMHPQPRMQNKKAYEHSHHGHTGFTRHSPRNGFNGFLRALPGDRAFLSPSSAETSSANLTPASRRQDHTTSPSASAPFVSAAFASTASRTNVRDVRTPLCGTGWREL